MPRLCLRQSNRSTRRSIRRSIRQCIAYLLIALLPLQAAAAARLTLCAEMPSTQSERSGSMGESCAQMVSAQAFSANDARANGTAQSHHDSTCWLGSICLASLGAAVAPAVHQVTHVASGVPVSSFPTTPYLSVIPDNPQRPPATL